MLLISINSYAQDSIFARGIIDTLTSANFWGRGYTNNGLQKATDYLSIQFKDYGIKPLKGKSFLQQFSYPVNTFPGKMELAINGKQLTPGVDFIISPESKGFTGEGQLVKRDSIHFVDLKNRVIVLLQDKLTFSAEQRVADFTLIEIDKKKFKETPMAFKANIDEMFVNKFNTANICGMVKGTSKPDSMIVYTAHYDHLGGMGDKTFFPGANDNASGVSMVMALANYYAKHPHPYTMAFILFSGEEAGLLGSKYFTEHPLLPLKNIKLLVNLDLEGTGVDGITVVNATVCSKEFALLKQVNQQGNYLVKINSRGKAPNSDHYFFTEKGVPAIYWYTLGGIKAYHDVYDISATLPLTVFNNMFKMIVGFNWALMGNN